jgi:hypothetical protein
MRGSMRVAHGACGAGDCHAADEYQRKRQALHDFLFGAGRKRRFAPLSITANLASHKRRGKNITATIFSRAVTQESRNRKRSVITPS